MALVSMNVRSDDVSPADYDPSPTLYLTEAQCEALGLTVAPQAGTVVTITARAVFQTVTQYAPDEDGDRDVCATLKLTDMELGASTESANPASVLYGTGYGGD